MGHTIAGSPARRIAVTAVLYGVLIIGALLVVLPFYWMFSLSTHTTADIYTFPPPLFFGEYLVQNFQNLLEVIPFFTHFFNSLFVAALNTVLVLLFCSMAGYAFAVYDFPGKNWLFAICLGTLMIPWMASIIPWFIVIRELGWIDSYLALIIPNSANAFGIFWMRQYISGAIKKDLLDAARIDGCPEWLIFFRVIAPTLTPAFSALGIFNFVAAWNNFIVPLIVLRTPERLTLPVALNRLVGDPTRGFDVGVLMMGTSLAVLPMLAVFLIASKKFIAGMMAGAVKG